MPIESQPNQPNQTQPMLRPSTRHLYILIQTHDLTGYGHKSGRDRGCAPRAFGCTSAYVLTRARAISNCRKEKNHTSKAKFPFLLARQVRLAADHCCGAMGHSRPVLTYPRSGTICSAFKHPFEPIKVIINYLVCISSPLSGKNSVHFL